MTLDPNLDHDVAEILDRLADSPYEHHRRLAAAMQSLAQRREQRQSS